MISGDASEFYALARDFGVADKAALPTARPAIQAGAELTKQAWQSNARATSGTHGRHYPNSITYDTRILAGSVIGEVGPDSSRPQGGMGRGFEFGSENQPPHLDGLRAMDTTAPAVEKLLGEAIEGLLP
ncbi:hypothetical protein [uncultured Arthrobacter sp.]|uniref:hypothetical protein n=1 Tax=uncultured Arthrobacter sp. TaxID=114050 RepID=UPI0025D5A0CF|nr:hypothetical protein [uncultured Arthrobacter sp.]